MPKPACREYDLRLLLNINTRESYAALACLRAIDTPACQRYLFAPLKLANEEVGLAGECINLSVGGMLLRTPEQLQTGEVVIVTFRGNDSLQGKHVMEK